MSAISFGKGQGTLVTRVNGDVLEQAEGRAEILTYPAAGQQSKSLVAEEAKVSEQSQPHTHKFSKMPLMH